MTWIDINERLVQQNKELRIKKINEMDYHDCIIVYTHDEVDKVIELSMEAGHDIMGMVDRKYALPKTGICIYPKWGQIGTLDITKELQEKNPSEFNIFNLDYFISTQ